MAQEKLKQVTSTRTVTMLREEEAGKVKVVYGVHAIEASLAGRTVQSVREALAQPLNISPQAVTLVDGQEVESTHVLSPAELLEFVRYAGEKGLRGRSHPSESALGTPCQGWERWRSSPSDSYADGLRGIGRWKGWSRAPAAEPEPSHGDPTLYKAIRLDEDCPQRNPSSRRMSHSGRRNRPVAIE